MLSILSAKVITTAGYKKVGGPKRTNKIGSGPLYADGEKVKRGQIIWNHSTLNGYSWGCLPGKMNNKLKLNAKRT